VLYEDATYDPNVEYFEEMKHFLACVRGEQSPAIKLLEAARSLQIVLRARETIQRQTPMDHMASVL
jgi:hypothetical protein